MTSTTPSHPDAALVEAVATGLATDIADAILAPLVHEMIDGTPAWELRLVADWLPALGRPVDRLDYGGLIADVGPGRDRTTPLLARRWPLATVHGAASVATLPDGSYDLICLLDCLHVHRDPVASVAAAAAALDPRGILMVVSPIATAAPGATLGLLHDAGLTQVAVVATSPLYVVSSGRPAA